jgi:sigma-B regulation protein RsbU (phosphoserine phosphatase)
MFQGRLVGTLALGRKRSGEAYTEEEIDALCLVANEAALALETAALSEARERQARLQQELSIARSIQTRLLPPARLSLPGYEILSRTEPSTEVGGDFYNLFEVAGSGDRGPSTQLLLPVFDSQWQATAPAHLGILVGDVAGKGVPAALFMAVTTTLIQGQAQLLPSPAATLAAANAQLNPVMRRPGGGQPLFATAVYGVLGVARGEMRLANAGQTPPIHWSASGDPRYLRLSGTPLGAMPAASYEEQVIRLAPGDRLLLCSDGFIESLDAAGEPVGYSGFLRRLAALGERSGHELIDALFGADGAHRGDPLHRDDRTVVLITAMPE